MSAASFIALTRSHPRERVDWVCNTALERRCFRFKILKRLADEAAERAQQPELIQHHEVIRDPAEYGLVMS